MTSESSAQKASLLYGILTFPIFFNTVLSNQIPASTFIYLALLIIVENKNKKISKFILCGLFLAIGNFLRAEGIVYVCSIIGVYLINVLCAKDYRKEKRNHLGIVLFTFTYFFLSFAASLTIQLTHLNNEGLKNNLTYQKFVFGLNSESCGAYNNDDLYYVYKEKEAKDEIINRIKGLANVQKLINLTSCKTKTMWNGGNNYWTFLNIESKIHNVLGFKFSTYELLLKSNSLNLLIHSVAFLLAIIGIIWHFYQKKIDGKIVLFINVLAINFIVYSLIEVQGRYIYLFQISIFVLASLGFELIKEIREKRLANKKILERGMRLND